MHVEILPLGRGCVGMSQVFLIFFILNKHMITLKRDFTKDQIKLADKLYNELMEHCDEVREYCTTSIYGLSVEEDADGIFDEEVLLSFEHSDPEKNGHETIFLNY